MLRRCAAIALDRAMCLAMFACQQRHRLHPQSREALASYIHHHHHKGREIYFEAPPLVPLMETPDERLKWESPVTSPYPENNIAHVDLFPCEAGWTAPTVIFLHALMSTRDAG